MIIENIYLCEGSGYGPMRYPDFLLSDQWLKHCDTVLR